MNGKIETRPLTEALGAEIMGVDIAQTVNTETFDTILSTFEANGILLFRDQKLTPEALIDFSRNFGKLDIDPQYQLPGYPEIYLIGNIMEDGILVSHFNNIEEEWHTDRCYMQRPSLGSLFYCLETPPEGGDTKFAGAQAAYDALPDAKKQFIENRRSVHSYEELDRYLRIQDPTRPYLTNKERRDTPPIAQPIARTHPSTGRKSLYVCPEVTTSVDGMDEAVGKQLIRELTEHATQPQFMYRHKWRVGDLMIWDNRSTLHTGTAFDASKYSRVMWRTTIEGDVPF